MTLNLPLLYWFWFVEYCQTSPNKKGHLWHVTSILVCCIFGLMNAEGQQNNLSCQSIEIRAGIRIEVVGQPNILVPLGRFTTYVLWKMQWMTWLRWKWGKLATFLLFRYTAQLYTVFYSRTCHVSIRISYIGRRLMLI